jgi:hypothetical protein
MYAFGLSGASYKKSEVVLLYLPPSPLCNSGILALWTLICGRIMDARLFQPVRLAGGWCWFVLREKYCWLVAGGWFVLRGKYCWLVTDKPKRTGCLNEMLTAVLFKWNVQVGTLRPVAFFKKKSSSLQFTGTILILAGILICCFYQ